MADKDYYSILGLSEKDKSLNGKEFKDKITKQFRKLSMQWHPDRWVSGTEEEKKTAEEKFKEIAEAYSVLSDEQKRAEYDNRGSGGFNPFPNGFDPFAPGGPFDRFRNMGGGFPGFDPSGFNPFGGMGGGYTQTGPTPMNGSNVMIDITITLQEAYNGGTRTVRYYKNVECSHCHGTGSDDGVLHTCTHCNGSGHISRTKWNGNMQFTTITDCPYCNGTGKIPSKACHVCGGLGTTSQMVEHDIPIPRGVDYGTIMGYAGLGNPGKNGGADGALEVRFIVKNDPYYQRKNENLIHYEEIPFTDALLGVKREIKCIDGSTVPLKLNELTRDGLEVVYPGKGMPTLDRYGRNGPNGYFSVFIKYKIPTKLTEKQKELLRKFNEEWEQK